MTDEWAKDSTALLKRVNQLEKSLANRLIRTESRLVRGFAELGVDVGGEPGWADLDEHNKTLTIDTLGRSLVVLIAELERLGAKHYGELYTIVYCGEIIGSIRLGESGDS